LFSARVRLLDLVPASTPAYEMLNSWLNTGRDRSARATTDDDDDMLAYSLDEIETVSLYAAEDSSSTQNKNDSLDEDQSQDGGAAVASASSENPNASEAHRLLGNMSSFRAARGDCKPVAFAARNRTLMSVRHCRAATLKRRRLSNCLQPAGEWETLENGAQIIKDSLGRIIEVRSPLGPVLRTRYDDNGHLRSLSARQGRQYPILWRIRQTRRRRARSRRSRAAAGESMAIDRVGRLSIVRKDGQFWSIDWHAAARRAPANGRRRRNVESDNSRLCI